MERKASILQIQISSYKKLVPSLPDTSRLPVEGNLEVLIAFTVSVAKKSLSLPKNKYHIAIPTPKKKQEIKNKKVILPSKEITETTPGSVDTESKNNQKDKDVSRDGIGKDKKENDIAEPINDIEIPNQKKKPTDRNVLYMLTLIFLAIWAYNFFMKDEEKPITPIAGTNKATEPPVIVQEPDIPKPPNIKNGGESKEDEIAEERRAEKEKMDEKIRQQQRLEQKQKDLHKDIEILTDKKESLEGKVVVAMDALRFVINQHLKQNEAYRLVKELESIKTSDDPFINTMKNKSEGHKQAAKEKLDEYIELIDGERGLKGKVKKYNKQLKKVENTCVSFKNAERPKICSSKHSYCKKNNRLNCLDLEVGKVDLCKSDQVLSTILTNHIYQNNRIKTKTLQKLIKEKVNYVLNSGCTH